MRKRALDERLVFGVGEGSGFVKHHDGRVFQDGARQGNTLHLAARQVCASGAKLRVDALRKLRHDVIALRG